MLTYFVISNEINQNPEDLPSSWAVSWVVNKKYMNIVSPGTCMSDERRGCGEWQIVTSLLWIHFDWHCEPAEHTAVVLLAIPSHSVMLNTKFLIAAIFFIAVFFVFDHRITVAMVFREYFNMIIGNKTLKEKNGSNFTIGYDKPTGKCTGLNFELSYTIR